MSKTYYKVIGLDGFARYRASNRAYVSYSHEKDSWSSKMLPGNVPVEALARAPKRITVRGEAWGAKVARTYFEGERPVVCTIAYKGTRARLNWDKVKASGWTEGVRLEDEKAHPEWFDAADPDAVHFSNDGYTEKSRAACVHNVEHVRDNIARRDAGKLGKHEGSYGCNDVMLVELK